MSAATPSNNQTAHPLQPTFDEAQRIEESPELQNLLRWYPERRDLILRAWRRRNPHPGCDCPMHRRRGGRCCVQDGRPPPPPTTQRRRRPSKAGSYREQLHK